MAREGWGRETEPVVVLSFNKYCIWAYKPRQEHIVKLASTSRFYFQQISSAMLKKPT